MWFMWFSVKSTIQFVIFKRLSYCFKETIGFDVNVSFASRPLSRLSDITNQVILQNNFEKIKIKNQFYGIFDGLKITNLGKKF